MKFGSVAPAQAGAQVPAASNGVPACAGTTR